MRYFNGRTRAAAEEAGNEQEKLEKQELAGQGVGPVGAASLQC